MDVVKSADDIIDEAINKPLTELRDSVHKLPLLPIAASEELSICVDSPETLPKAIFNACFNLVRDNVRDYYISSTLGWSTPKKRREMGEYPTRTLYLIDKKAELVGFLNWQPVVEEGEAVIYCYELQISKKWHGRGLGKWFMRTLETLTKTFYELQDVLLTAFTANIQALKFYDALG